MRRTTGSQADRRRIFGAAEWWQQRQRLARLREANRRQHEEDRKNSNAKAHGPEGEKQ